MNAKIIKRKRKNIKFEVKNWIKKCNRFINFESKTSLQSMAIEKIPPIW